MADNYYIGETIYYPSEAVNFIVDLWREFTNDDAFPVNETEFPRMNEFIQYLKNEGHFEKLQGRWYFPNMDNMQYLWEFYLIPEYTFQVDDDTASEEGTRMLMAPVDYGPGFEGFVKSLLYHMMNKSWITDEASVPGSGFELETNVKFKVRLLASSGIACSTEKCDYDPGTYFKIKCMTTTLKSIERKLKRFDDGNFYEILLFDIPKMKVNEHEYCVYKILKNIIPNVGGNYNREYDDYNDVLNTCQTLLTESNWSLYELDQCDGYWTIKNFYENIHKKFKIAFVIFITGKHAKLTCIDGDGKRGCEYFKSKCPTCEEYVKLSDRHFNSCNGIKQDEDIIRNVKMKTYTIDHVLNMHANSQKIIGDCIRALENKQSIYVNGPGGSGKSELIKEIVKKFPGKTKVLASTAEVANRFIGGQTVHSFFHLGMFEKKFKMGVGGAFENDRVGFEKFVNSKFDSCPEYVIIDEAGMLGGEFMEIIDYVCRVITQCFDRRFGTIKFAFMLDECQLPPVKCKLKMYTTPQLRLVRLQNSFTLDAPWRLANGVTDSEELLKQFIFLEKCRLGIKPELDFINFILDVDVNYSELDGTVLVRTNESAKKINRAIFDSEKFIKLWENNTFEYYMGMQVICTSNVSKTWGTYKPYNGARGCVIGSTQCNGETVLCVRFEKGECMFRNYYSEKDISGKQRWTIDLVCSKVITIHRSQGMTIAGKVYIEWMYGKNHFNPGMLYVALSRCQNLRNITVIRKSSNKPEKFFDQTLKYSPLAVAVANDPKKLQPAYLIEDEEGFYSVADNKKRQETFTFRDKRYFKPQKVKRGKMLLDYKFMEYSHLFDHSIIIDHETANGSDGKQRPICTYVKYYVNGKPRHFNELLADYGNIPHHEFPRTDGVPRYGWDDEYKMMEFSLDYSEHPIRDLCMGICMILELALVYIHHKIDIGKDWKCICMNPMTDWGFNNNGFDIFFFFKEYLQSSKWDYIPNLVSAGTTLKLFNLKVRDKNDRDITIYQTRDLMQLTGPGSFGKAVESWCKNISKDLMAGINLENYIIPFTPRDFEHYCDARGRDLFTEQELRRDFEEFKERKRGDLKIIKMLSKNTQYYIEGGKFSKGFAPLKLVVEKLGANVQTWKGIPKCMNLIAEYGGRLNFVNNCYYDREKPAVYEKIAEYGYEFFTKFDLKKDYKDYARLDVFLTELLMRAMNDIVYRFGSEITSKTGEKFSIASSVGEFISGTRTCLLRYATTAQLVQQITFTNLPDCCIKSDTGLYIETELYLLPKTLDKMVNGVLGGKTLARRMHFQSKGDGDYMQYGDFSGMYMKILEKYEYPYGGFKHYANKHTELSVMEKQYRDRDEILFTRCALFKVRVKANDLEIEPVYGEKRLRKSIAYTTGAATVYATNYEMRVYSDYGVELLAIEECIQWKKQIAMFENVMKYYAALKNAAEDNDDKVARAFAKLMANSTFGTMAKSDKNESMMVWSTPRELMAIFEQHGMSKFMRAPTTVGKFHMAKIDTGASTRLNTNVPYLGRFTLGASKIMLYDAIRIGYGKDRFSDENFDNMLAYGDTDSLLAHRSFFENLIADDKTKEEKDQSLFYTGGNPDLKAGKLTDELKDDLDKYFDDAEYVDAVKNVNRNWSDIANPRVVESLNPAAKSGGVKFEIPAFDYNGKSYEKRYGYKTFCKGIPANAFVDVKVPKRLGHLKKPPGVYKLGHNKETYELCKFAYQHLLPLSSQRQEVLKKIIFPNSKEYEDALRAMDIKSVKEGEKRAWKSVPEKILEETFIVRPFSKKRKHAVLDVSSGNAENSRRQLVTRDDIDSVKRGERTMFEISSGQRLWNH